MLYLVHPLRIKHRTEIGHPSIQIQSIDTGEYFRDINPLLTKIAVLRNGNLHINLQLDKRNEQNI